MKNIQQLHIRHEMEVLASKNIRKKQTVTAPDPHGIELPTLPDSIFPTLPLFLQKVVAKAHTREERDILLLGSLVTLSPCFPKFYSIYDEMKVFSNLYLFITAQASAGKGKLVHCKQLIMPIHQEMRQQTKVLKDQYDLDMQKYKKTEVIGFRNAQAHQATRVDAHHPGQQFSHRDVSAAFRE